MDDSDSFYKILVATTPAECRQIGQEVKNFDQDLWDKSLEKIVNSVISQKFFADEHCQKVLLSTGQAPIAECGKTNTVWGVGLRARHCRRSDRSSWRGRNVLGAALVLTRQQLQDGNVPSRHSIGEDINPTVPTPVVGRFRMLVFNSALVGSAFCQLSNMYEHSSPFVVEVPAWARRE